MKPIEAYNQVRLGPARCFQLALTGMSFRIFRSGVTMAILALATAFLVHMLTYGLIAGRTERQAWRELGANRRMGELLTRLQTPDTRATILDQLAGDPGSPGRLAEYRRWLGGGRQAFDQARAAAKRMASAASDLKTLPVTQQSVLLGLRTPSQLFERLSVPRRYQRFVSRMKNMGVRPPLGDLDQFHGFVMVEYPHLLAAVRRIRQGHRRAVEQVRQALPGRSPQQWAIHPPARFAATLQAAGFSFSARRIPSLRAFAQRAQDIQTVGRYVTRPRVRAAVARKLGMDIDDVGLDTALNAIDGPGLARWFSGVLRETGAAHRLSPRRVLDLARHYQRRRRLQSAVGNAPPQQAGRFFGLSTRTQWLIALSFLVCVVGVANAMLMSVTDRFTEIATMKCLGAMDLFVMMMFVFEAIFQGVVGGLIGLALGIVLALLRAFIEFGALLGAAVGAAGHVALAATLSLAVGVVLAAVAAVGPSWIAARLAPMEAMRVE